MTAGERMRALIGLALFVAVVVLLATVRPVVSRLSGWRKIYRKQRNGRDASERSAGNTFAAVLRSLRDELASGKSARAALTAVLGSEPPQAEDRVGVRIWLDSRVKRLCPDEKDSDREMLSRRLATVLLVCEESGSPIVPQLDALAAADSFRRMAIRRKRQAIAVPEATVRLFLLLPIVLMVGGSLLGADPLAFLLTPTGLLCCALGIALIAIGIAWYRRVIIDFERKARA